MFDHLGILASGQLIVLVEKVSKSLQSLTHFYILRQSRLASLFLL